MTHRSTLPFTVPALVLLAAAVTAEDITVQTARPVVVRTVPAAGSTDVDPSATEIRITFSKDMLDGSWSIVRASDKTFPEARGKGHYLDDKRTLLLPVRLEPGRHYALWVNTDQFDNCKDTQRRAAVPYLLVFQTKGTPAGGSKPDKPEEPAADPAVVAKAFDALADDMARHYSHFNLKEIDWPALRERYRPRAVTASSEAEFINVLAELLGKLRDGHVWIRAAGKNRYVYTLPNRQPNLNRAATFATLDHPKACGSFAAVGRTKVDGFGAVVLLRQSDGTADTVKQVVDFIQANRDAPGFLIDLRAANGGNETLAMDIAAKFCSRDVVYARSQYRNGPGSADLGTPLDRTLRAGTEPFAKPVVCLLGPGCVSSGEGFAQMMRALPNVTTVGARTRGSTGNPKPFTLPGVDVTVFYSRWLDLLPDGSTVEDSGIKPAVEVDVPASAYADKDPTWEKAVEVLREKSGKG